MLPLLAALACICVLDLQTRTIPNVVTLPGLVYALAVAATLGTPPIAEAVRGAIVGGGVVFIVVILSRGRVGGGDAKLAAMLGAAIGWQAILLTLGASQALAAVAVLVTTLVNRRLPRGVFPVGAFIAVIGSLMLIGRP
ncbi:MAG TPA: A24 family peptidase [Candidatus Tectomicrobia bacterium]|nr:A24 family peptidase [Candidatus Tectomicrobia bacterium]